MRMENTEAHVCEDGEERSIEIKHTGLLDCHAFAAHGTL